MKTQKAAGKRQLLIENNFKNGTDTVKSFGREYYIYNIILSSPINLNTAGDGWGREGEKERGRKI